MKLKKYRGDDARALKERIRRELGEEAVIVSARQVIEGGVMGFFGRRRFEMVAALPADGEEMDGRGSLMDLSVPGEAPSESGVGGVGLRKSGGGAGTGGMDAAIRSGARDRGGSGAASGGAAPKQEATGRPAPFVPLHLTAEAAATREEYPEKAVFLGPPGAGKTSCLGRLAWTHGGGGERVTVLSLEEEGRLSGARRWGEFWSVLGARFRACLTVEELLEEASAAERIALVDTPPLGAKGLQAWCEVLVERLPEFARFLVVEAGYDLEEVAAWMELARPLKPYRLVISKVDLLFRAERVREIAELTDAGLVYLARDAAVDSPLFPWPGRRAFSKNERAGADEAGRRAAKESAVKGAGSGGEAH